MLMSIDINKQPVTSYLGRRPYPDAWRGRDHYTTDASQMGVDRGGWDTHERQKSLSQ